MILKDIFFATVFGSCALTFDTAMKLRHDQRIFFATFVYLARITSN